MTRSFHTVLDSSQPGQAAVAAPNVHGWLSRGKSVPSQMLDKELLKECGRDRLLHVLLIMNPGGIQHKTEMRPSNTYRENK